jgi:predicted pyridoxine 5'-phosphate oxidase superfamily flavin-nucleotide-binding protein
MGYKFAEIAFTPTVKLVQETMGSRAGYANQEERGNRDFTRFDQDTASFVATRDSFYIASVSETGWPYVQHRGGPAGFVKVLDERTLGFADYRGNRQYVSVGNLMSDDRVSLFFMDYTRKARLKLFGRVKLIAADDKEMLAKLRDENHDAKIERGFVITLEAYDWNCPKYITERFTLAEIDQAVVPLKQRIVELEAKLTKAGIEP